MTRYLFSFAIVALGLAGCDDQGRTCTKEERTAVVVTVTSPEGLPVDGVVMEPPGHQGQLECGEISISPGTYTCMEAGGGVYVIHVYSGDLVWTKPIDVPEDEAGCHVAATAQLAFELHASTADP